MEVIVYCFSQGSTNAGYFYEIIDTCRSHALKPTELAQQFPAFFRAEARDAFKR